MSTTTLFPVAENAPVINQPVERGILERAVCIALKLNGIGNRKKVSTTMIDVPMDQPAETLLTGAPAPEPTVDAFQALVDDVLTWTARDGERIAHGATEEEARANLAAIPVESVPVSNPQVDKSMLGVSKALLSSPELKAIRKHDGRIRQFVYGKCLPYEVGIHLLPIELVVKVEEELKALAATREELIDAFIKAYPEQIEAAGKRLLVLFNPADYKGLQQVRESFVFQWQYISFGTPGKLRDISPALFEAEQEKAAKKWSEASDAIQQVLRAQMRDLIDKLQGKLSPSADGKPKMFRKENVENLRDFLEDFDIRNVTSDSELKALVERAKSILGNVDAGDLRSDETLRSDLAKGFDIIKTELNDIVAEGSFRAISFED